MNDKITHQYELCFGKPAKASKIKTYYTLELWYAIERNLGLSFSSWECLAVDFGWMKKRYKLLKHFISNHFREFTKMVLHNNTFHEFAKRQKNFLAVHKAIALCKILKVNATYHFRELTKMISSIDL